MRIKKIIKTIVILFLVQLHITAQVDGDLNTSLVSELDAVQLPSDTWISSSMEIVPNFGFGYRVLIHRSIDNGYTWAIIDSLEMYGDYIAIGDPVMSVDNQGNAYFLIMEKLVGTNYIHLTLYVSEDDGQSWSIKSQPFAGQKFADTPHLLIDEFNTFYISYTEFDPISILPSFTHFIKSEDGGVSWSSPEIFDSSQSNSVVGSYFNLSKGNQINLAYGDYSTPTTYFVSSEDNGDSWNSIIEFPNTIAFAINKVISNINHETICVLTHGAHDPKSDIHLNYSIDNGLSWNSYNLAIDACMAEGYMDNDGIIHITYNQFIDNDFEVNYVYSIDDGITFSDKLTLFTGETYIDFSVPGQVSGGIGESQSMVLGNDDMFHLTFVDWTDSLKAKHLIFEPFEIFTSIQNAKSNGESNLSIFPNPSSDFLKINLENPEHLSSYRINTVEGKTQRYGNFDSQNELNIDINDLQSGIYLLCVQSGNQIIVKKFIKI